jgi:hypothetical protein
MKQSPSWEGNCHLAGSEVSCLWWNLSALSYADSRKDKETFFVTYTNFCIRKFCRCCQMQVTALSEGVIFIDVTFENHLS